MKSQYDEMSGIHSSSGLWTMLEEFNANYAFLSSSERKEKLAEIFVRSWRGPVVPRSEVGRFSCGLLHPRTMANRDSDGTGISTRIRIHGKRVAYLASDVARYLVDKIDFV